MGCCLYFQEEPCAFTKTHRVIKKLVLRNLGLGNLEGGDHSTSAEGINQGKGMQGH